MKLISKISIAAAVISSGIIFTGCKKILDKNNNPNSLTVTRADYLMTGALGNTARLQIGSAHIIPGSWSGFYAHSTSYTGSGNEKNYSVTNTDFDWWTDAYDNIYDYQRVIETADATNMGFWKAPARVMQCLVFARLVDAYGNIPFTEAVKGIGNLSPKFDSAQTVYDSLVLRLDAAIAAMQAATWPTSADFTTQDVYFALNKTNWIRFANTIKLRLLLHQDFMGTRDGYITTNILTTAALGYLTTNVMWQPGFQNITGKLNAYYATYGYNEVPTVTTNHQFRKMGKVIIDWLKTTSKDTFRLQGLAWPAGAQITAPLPSFPTLAVIGTYTGVPLGAGASYPTASGSAMGPFYIQKGNSSGDPLVVFSLAESLLMQAEASFKYPTVAAVVGVAQTLYESGVRAHFRLVGNMVTLGPAASKGSGNLTNIANNAANTQADGAYTAYIARPIDNVNWVASTDKLRAILIQKWVAFTHINGLEAWTDYRKSSVTKVGGHTFYSIPANPRSLLAPGPTDEPLRMVYPLAEVNTNGNHVPTVKKVQDSPIFWDVNN
jgi:Starch-binding associating with outer membrane